jgi:hypothetical protein
MPDVGAATVVRQRNFSKTSVYAWNNKAESWEETKVEPDYSKPAYYVSRVGISGELHTHHPSKAPGTSPGTANFQLRKRISNYDLAKAVRAATRLNLLAPDALIYRVTENQAPKIATTTPLWVHIPTYLAIEIEKLVRTDTSTALASSNLASNTNMYGVAQWVDAALSAGTGGTSALEKNNAALKNLHTICSVDPLFLFAIGTRYHLKKEQEAANAKGFSSSPNVVNNRELCGALFPTMPQHVQGETAAYNTLAETCLVRYSFIVAILGQHSLHVPNSHKHLSYYLDGYLKDVKLLVASKAEDYVKSYPQLAPLAQSFKDLLDKKYIEVYGAIPIY